MNKSLCKALTLSLGLLAMACSTNTENSYPRFPDFPETPPENNENNAGKEEVNSKEWKDFMPIDLSRNEARVAYEAYNFSWRFFKTVINDPDNTDNIAISPLSAEIDLSMLANGAKGDTRDEILKAIGFENLDIKDVNSFNQKLTSTLTDIDDATTLSLANAMWFIDPYIPYDSYLDVLRTSYDADAYSVKREEMVDIINAWCSEKTHGIIKRIIDQPSDMAIANAVYFKSYWSHSFDPELSEKGVFNGADGNTDVWYMKDNSFYNCVVNDKYTIVNIPFGNQAYCLHIFLPAEGVSLNQLVDMISQISQYDITGRPYETELSLPRFKSEFTADLNDYLKALGMVKAFTAKADFSALTDYDMMVSKVRQSTAFEINETGGEGASVTITQVVESAGPEDPREPDKIKIDVNRPFVYSVTETSTNTHIFIGAIRNI